VLASDGGSAVKPLDDEATPSDVACTLASSPVAIRSSLPPVRRPSLTPGATGHSGSSTPSALRSNLEETLRLEEAARTRGFGRVIALLTALALALLPFIGGEPVLGSGAALGLLVLGLTAAWVWRRGATDERYSPKVFRRFAWIAVATSSVIQLHLGVFSPTPVGVTLGVAFFCLTDDRRLAVALAAAVSVIYVACGGLILLGVTPDVGVISPAGSPIGARVFMLVMVPFAYAVTCWQALLSRRTTLEALEKARAAQVEANRRAAQRDEANQNLEQLVRAAAGREGRYSGERVGEYELAEVIGQGGMGEVYAAKHVATREPAAVKLLNAASQRQASNVERFWREVEVTSRLQVPNVVRALGFGRTTDGSPFIAMELLRGQDLSAKLRQVQRLEVAECVRLAEQAGAGIDAAHRAGIVHRDIKPQNLFRSENDGVCWKVLDFGVSKLAGSSGTLTRLAIVGTPGYMSPEQAESLDAGPRSDVFSLGAVLYRALTGRPPFSGPDTPQILFQIVHRMPPRPTLIVPSLPSDVDAVLAIALAKDPEQRFASAGELSDALRGAAAGQLAPPVRARGESLIERQTWGVRS
jgi:serine/threonine-protein kinase